MRIIDRYLLGQFVRVFVIAWFSLTGLFIVFDAFSNLDEFLHYSEKHGNLLGLMASYYGYRSVYFFDRTSAVLAMVAVMFTVTWIQRHNELTALLAAGISRFRVVVPVLVAACVISVGAATSRELLIPRLADELQKSPQDLLGDAARELRPCYDPETKLLLNGRSTVAATRQIHRPAFVLPASLDRYGKHLVAADAYYQAPQGGRPGGYLMKQVSDPAELLKGGSLSIGERRVIITPPDAPDWLAADECFVATGVTFEQLAAGRAWRQFSSTAALVAGLKNPSLDFGADVRVLIHARIVQPLLDMTLLFLGVPLVLGRDTRNLYLAVGLCVALVAGFMLVVLACQYLGAIYLISPALAAWLPMMIFVPAAVGLFDQLRK